MKSPTKTIAAFLLLTATPAAINTSNDDLATNDRLRIDVDAVSTTPPAGLIRHATQTPAARSRAHRRGSSLIGPNVLMTGCTSRTNYTPATDLIYRSATQDYYVQWVGHRLDSGRHIADSFLDTF